jgi:hypothetical protein
MQSHTPLTLQTKQSELETRSAGELPDIEKLCPNSVSRNKRAVIERIVARWVSSSELGVA